MSDTDKTHLNKRHLIFSYAAFSFVRTRVSFNQDKEEKKILLVGSSWVLSRIKTC